MQAVFEVLHLAGVKGLIDFGQIQGGGIGRKDFLEVFADIGLGRPVQFGRGAFKTLENSITTDSDDHVRNGIDNRLINVMVDFLRDTRGNHIHARFRVSIVRNVAHDRWFPVRGGWRTAFRRAL